MDRKSLGLRKSTRHASKAGQDYHKSLTNISGVGHTWEIGRIG